MRWMKWTGILAALLLIVSCFLPWVTIESKNITISGIESTGTRFGKPGYFHFLMSFFFLVFSFTPRIWAKRINLLIVAMNFAWALRNYFIVTSCEAGECPDKQLGIYIIPLASTIMMIAALFPDMKVKGQV
jgi:hypothetical protein